MRYTAEYEGLLHIAKNFSYAGLLKPSAKLLQLVKDDVDAMRGLWDFEQKRTKV
jgi:hypothetical protein